MVRSLSVNRQRLQAVDFACGGQFRLVTDGCVRGRVASLASTRSSLLGNESGWCLPTISSGLRLTIGDVPDLSGAGIRSGLFGKPRAN
jgi:hypothetical protein